VIADVPGTASAPFRGEHLVTASAVVNLPLI
jgi:hypothetical protein